jgi:hypothetical protein
VAAVALLGVDGGDVHADARRFRPRRLLAPRPPARLGGPSFGGLPGDPPFRALRGARSKRVAGRRLAKVLTLDRDDLHDEMWWESGKEHRPAPRVSEPLQIPAAFLHFSTPLAARVIGAERFIRPYLGPGPVYAAYAAPVGGLWFPESQLHRVGMAGKIEPFAPSADKTAAILFNPHRRPDVLLAEEAAWVDGTRLERAQMVSLHQARELLTNTLRVPDRGLYS